MVREPPSVLLLSPTNPRHLLPTLNTKCLLSPSSVPSPGDSMEGRAPSQHPNTTIHMRAKLAAPKTVKSAGSEVRAQAWSVGLSPTPSVVGQSPAPPWALVFPFRYDVLPALSHHGTQVEQNQVQDLERPWPGDGQMTLTRHQGVALSTVPQQGTSGPHALHSFIPAKLPPPPAVPGTELWSVPDRGG